MCLMAAFVPHRPNKYFHVTASNGIVSSSPYTPRAIMRASPIALVRVSNVKVCGWRPHDGGAAHTGVGVRKPPREETAGCRARWRVRRYGDFVVWGSLAGCVDHLCRERSKRWRTRQVDSDSRNWRRAAKIDRRVGYPGRRDGEHGHGRSRRGEAEAQWNVAAKRFWS